MIEIAWLFPISVFFFGLAYFVFQYRSRKAGENATAVFWANRKFPLIYEQQDIGTGDETREQYDNAKKMLSHFGNKYNPPVHLWVYVADGENAKVGFSLWQTENIQRRFEIFEPYLMEKNRRAFSAGQVSQSAQLMHTGSIENNEN